MTNAQRDCIDNLLLNNPSIIFNWSIGYYSTGCISIEYTFYNEKTIITINEKGIITNTINL